MWQFEGCPELRDENALVERMAQAEKDNGKWLSYITDAMKGAKTFEIHCWNEETEWIELALQYGKLKDNDWRHGKIIVGDVTPEFIRMLLSQPKPTEY